MKTLDASPNLTERVYRAIVEDILDGILAPGAHLVQEQLAAELGVSRHPVQQAMALLKTDGLVEETGRRGLTVARLDPDRMRQHYEIRELLDGFAAREAAAAVRGGAVSAAVVMARAKPILEAGAAAIDEGSLRGQIRYDEELHSLIYELAGNPVISQVAEPVWRFLRRVMADVLRHAEPVEAIWAQHRAMIDAIRSGDPDAAERLAREHIDIATTSLSEAVRARDSAFS